MCCCLFSLGLESFVKVNIIVQDINDNKPELSVDEIFLCESDNAGTVRDIVTVIYRNSHCTVTLNIVRNKHITFI